jgi:hypothetical protein
LYLVTCHHYLRRYVTVHNLGYLETDGGCGGEHGQNTTGGKKIDKTLGKALAASIEKEAEHMDPQHVALTYHALGTMQKGALRFAMTPEGWTRLAGALRFKGEVMEPQGLAMTLNAMSKIDAAHEAVSNTAWGKLCTAVGNKAHNMEAQGVSMCIHAAGKIPGMASNMTPRAWTKLAEGIEVAAPKMRSSHLAQTFNALAKLPEGRGAMRPSNWVALARAVERLAPKMSAQNVATVGGALQVERSLPWSPKAPGLGFQPLNMSDEKIWFQAFAFTCNSYLYPAVYNGLALTKDAQVAMTMRAGGWEALSKALSVTAKDLDTLGVRQVFNALGMMEAARAEMTKQTWLNLSKAVERIAVPMVPKREGLDKEIADTFYTLFGSSDKELKGKLKFLDPQAVAITLSAVSKLDVHRMHDGSQLKGAGWDKVLARAVEARGEEMNAHGINMTLSALSTVKPLENAISSPAFWKGMAKAIENVAPTMNEHELSNGFVWLSKLKPLELAMSSDGWSALAHSAETLVPTTDKTMQVVNLLHGGAVYKLCTS